jgi:alpha-1,2-glucosyltransferase
VINSLLKSLHPSVKPAISFSFTLTTFPLLFFFTFLYYTDCGSTFTTLLGYWLSRKQHHLISAIVLFVSVLFRQTNIIWAGFIAGTVFLSQLNPQSSTRSFFHYFFNLFCEVYSKLFVILLMVWPYVVLAVVFGVFVISNGGIVLGDKSHHVASLHLPQIFYFCGFCCLFSVGSNLFHLKQFLKSLFNYLNVVVFMVLCLIGYIAVHYWTLATSNLFLSLSLSLSYEHPYLLADNRHYPFYIWKNFYRANDINRYLLIPVYSLCVSMMIMTLGKW